MPLKALFLREGGAFCLVRQPPAGIVPRCGVLCVPPFAEENNKSRHMMALQANRFAQLGAVTLTVDPAGTGDSPGEFADATWAHWLTDVEAALRELRGMTTGPIWLWGVRSGALLLHESITRRALSCDGLLLWNPVTSGRVFVRQFLRLATVQQVSAETVKTPAADPRQRLAVGQSVEAGGYVLNPALMLPMEEVALEQDAPGVPVLWFESATSPEGELSAGAERVIKAWRSAGVKVVAERVIGASFWASQEIETSDALLERTSAQMTTEWASIAGEPGRTAP